MAASRKGYPKKAIPGDWTEGDGYLTVLFCIPNSRDWRKTIVGVISELYFGRGWDGETGNIKQAQAMGREIFESMTMCNLTALLTRIAVAIENIAGTAGTNCCAPGQGTPQVYDGENVFYGTEQPIDRPASFGGEGEFATEEAFLSHLCDAANHIVAGIIFSLNNWSVLSLANLIAGALVVAFFVATPPLAVFIALGVAGFLYGSFAAMSNYVADHREDLVCVFYGADNYQDALIRLDDFVSTMVVALSLGPFEVQLTDFFRAMISTDVFNQAYRAVGLPAPIDPVSCDGCVTVLPGISLADVGVGSNLTVTDNGNDTWTIGVDITDNPAAGFYRGGWKTDDASALHVLSMSVVSGAWTAYSGYYGYTLTTGGAYLSHSSQADFLTHDGKEQVIYTSAVGTRIEWVVIPV